MTKFIFITGGVISSLGKGIASASIGRLLKKRGLKVFNQKFDPYLNIDPSKMSPLQHGEVFVTDDGHEADLDLGHYERFENVNLNRTSNITSGRIYSTILEKERQGKYGGKTVQFIPHVTNEIKDRIKAAAKTSGADVVITEIGGTVGDIESLPFIEAIRQCRHEFGYENTMYIHITLVPLLRANGEIKTKPTQQSVNTLRGYGISPDMLILRSENDIPKSEREKIAMFCGVTPDNIILAKDVPIIYGIVPLFKKQKIDDQILKRFNLEVTQDDGTEDWEDLVKRISKLKDEVTIGLVGKYVELHDCYLSASEALKHAGFKLNKKVNIKWILSDSLNNENIKETLEDVSGLLVSGGYGEKNDEGIVLALNYARTNNVPLLAINLGAQLMAIEFARNVLNIDDAGIQDLDENISNPVIARLPEKYKGIKLYNDMRLGLFDCAIEENSITYSCYNSDLISERHRHNYEFNNLYKEQFVENGLVPVGINPKTGLVEIFELKEHPFYIGVMFHPEFRSRVLKPHPLFLKLIEIASK